MDRRSFINTGLTAAAAVALAGRSVAQEANKKVWRKAVCLGMLPDMEFRQRMELARKCGFDGVEVYPTGDLAAAAEQRKIAEGAGIALHSVMADGWSNPLSSADPEVRKRGQDGLRGALRSAQAYGADAVLMVPGVVNAETRYVDAYDRSQASIREVIPQAEEVGVVIAVEDVWNNFLLSPREFALYVSEFESPWVAAYFDVGNIVKFGWSEDWVLTLGKHIRRIHLKDYKRGTGSFVNLRDGDVNWPKVTAALKEVGYPEDGWFTCELDGGDEAYLTDVAARVDAIFRGE